MLAFENANEKTKQALSMLPRGSTTAQLLEAAERKPIFGFECFDCKQKV